MIRTAAIGLAAVISTAALADGGTSATQAELAISENTKWAFAEDFSYHNFKSGDDLMVFDTKFVLPLEGGELNLSLPAYNQGGDTNIGDLGVGYEVLAFKGTNSLIGDYRVDLGGGVYLPVGDEQFQSANINPFFNAGIAFDVFGLDFVQTAEYRFVGGDAYSPWIGTSVASDTLTLGSTLGSDLGFFVLGLDFTQVFYFEGEDYLAFIGPCMGVELTSNIFATAAAHFQAINDSDYAETDYILSVGLKIEF